jgi:lipopolysaccharide export system permease protein
LDYSLHGNELFKNHLNFQSISAYYGYELVKRLDLLVPLCFMLSFLQTILHLNLGLELTAFLASGISLRALLKPILKTGVILAMILLINSEFLLPKAHQYIESIQTHEEQLAHKKPIDKVFDISLSDGSTLLYQRFNQEIASFEDVFWILSENNIWHIETLFEQEGRMIGKNADHFTRDEKKSLELKESLKSHHFFEMPTVTYIEEAKVIPYEQLSPSQLIYQCVLSHEKQTLGYAAALTQFWHKLSHPLFSLLLFFILIPLCTRYSRFKKTIRIYTIGICLFVGFYTLSSAMMILSGHHMIPASIATFGPFMVLGLPSAYRYFKS